MARKRKNAPEQPLSDLPRVPGVQQIYTGCMQDRDTWLAAFSIVDEMRRTRGGKHVYEQLIATRGAMDWVWIEETASSVSPSGDEAQLQSWHRKHLPDLSFDESEEVIGRIYFIATFTLVVAYLRAMFPAINPPTWWWVEMSAIRGEPYVEKSIADIVKDSYLENREQEALSIVIDNALHQITSG